MNVMVFAPHPDDEAIGCGGALCLHADKGDWTTVVFLTSGELGLKHLARDKAWNIRESEAREAAEILGVSEAMFLRCRDSHLSDDALQGIVSVVPLISREKPDVVYLPHPQEWHEDHKAAGRIAQGALKSAGLMPELRGYEIWTPLSQVDEAIDITAVWDRKLAAVRAHASQMGQWPYERAVGGLNQFRSAMSGRNGYAEAFSKGL